MCKNSVTFPVGRGIISIEAAGREETCDEAGPDPAGFHLELPSVRVEGAETYEIYVYRQESDSA